MQKIIVVLIFLSLVFITWDCKKKPIEPVIPSDTVSLSLDTTQNPIKFTVGQEWHYRKYMINKTDSGEPITIPETLVSYYNYKALKDTIINSETFLIIECDYWENYIFNNTLFKSRQAIHFGKDSIKIFEFLDSDRIIDVLLKPKKTTKTLVLNKISSQHELRKKMISNKLNLANFDTTIFYDLIYPIIFPLIKDSSWYYRKEGNPLGHLPMRKTFLCIDTITVPAGTFETYKVEWEFAEAFWEFNINDMYGFDWISKEGIAKRYFNYGSMQHTDEVGRVLGTFVSYDICEYMGPYNVPIDTSLFEYPEVVKAFVDSHYSHDRFMAYYNFIHSDEYNTDSLFLKWEIDPFSHDSIYFEVQREMSNDYYELVTKYDMFTQGWDDVQPDMISNDFKWIKDQVYDTEYMHRFRGFAISEIKTTSNNVDTIWMYYHDPDTKLRPKPFGHSDNQVKSRELIDSLYNN